MKKHTPLAALLLPAAASLTLACAAPQGDLDPSPTAAARLMFAPAAPTPESDAPTAAIARVVTADGVEHVLHGGEAVKWAVFDEVSGHAASVGTDGTLLRSRLDGGFDRVVAHAVLEPPVFDPTGSGRLLVANATAASEGNALWLATPERDGESVMVLAESGSHNERATFSPDGTRVAFMSDRTGLPSVYTAAVDGGPATQLTNVGVRRTPGLPPEGYTPPPMDGPLHWTDTGIEYLSPEGRVVLDPDTAPSR